MLSVVDLSYCMMLKIIPTTGLVDLVDLFRLRFSIFISLFNRFLGCLRLLFQGRSPESRNKRLSGGSTIISFLTSRSTKRST